MRWKYGGKLLLLSNAKGPVRKQMRRKRAANLSEARQAENAFKSMTPAQHLSAAQSELHVGASEDQVADGMKQLDALNGTPIEGRAKALRARYEAEQAQADKASAATQEREDAAAKEGTENHLRKNAGE